MTNFEKKLEEATEAMDRIKNDGSPLGEGITPKDCATVMFFLNTTTVALLDEIKGFLD